MLPSFSLVNMMTLGVFHIGDITLVVIGIVVDSLQSAVGEMDIVLALGVVAIPGLAVTKLGSMVW